MIALLLFAAALLCLWLAVVSHRRKWANRVQPQPPMRSLPGRAPVRSDVPHLLYLYPWADGTECYYGVSNEPAARHRRHGTDPDDRWWYANTTGEMIPIRWYPNRRAALAAERAAIRAAAARGAWLANTHHNPRGRLSA